MKRILVPVDFTELSDYAVNLAAELSEKLNYNITFIHAVHVSGEVLLDDNGNLIPSGEFDPSGLDMELNNATAKLMAISNSVGNGSKHIARFGSTEKVILNELNGTNYDLVVMATHGATGVKGHLLGSHAEVIAMRSPVPVLSIKSAEKLLKNVVFASSFNSPFRLPEPVISILKELNAEITFLTVVKSENPANEEEIISRINKSAKLSDIDNFQVVLQVSDDVESGIESYCKENNVGILIFESKGKTGFKKWVTGCVSADLVNHYDHALLTFTNRMLEN